MASDEASETNGKPTSETTPKNNDSSSDKPSSYAVDVVCVLRLQTGDDPVPIEKITGGDVDTITDALAAAGKCTDVHRAIAEFSLAVDRFRQYNPTAKAMMSGFFGIQDWIEL